MPNNLDTAKAKLTIISRGLSPEEISERIGLRWDDARWSGDPKGQSTEVWAENIWWLYETSEGERGTGFELALADCIERLCKRIGLAAEQINKLSMSEQSGVWPLHAGSNGAAYVTSIQEL